MSTTADPRLVPVSEAAGSSRTSSSSTGTTRIRSWVRALPVGRAGLREVMVLASLWIGYSATRLVASDDLVSARRRAQDILELERLVHLDMEAWLNHAVAPVTQVAVPMALWYASLHYLVTPVVLVFLYLRRRADYGRSRTALALGTVLGLAAYLLIPTAPPRLMPDSRYVDVLARTADYGWWSTHASAPAGLGGLSNELAAMPSLHVGWALWVAWAMWRHVGALGRSVAVLYAIGTTVVVLATGNHWVLDAVGGAAVVALGIVVSRWLHGRSTPARDRPREEVTAKR